MLKADTAPEKARTSVSPYPPPHDEKFKGRKTWPLTGQWKLTQFEVNMVELPPGAWSTPRHWHRNNDELVAVTDEAEEIPRAGDCIAFKAGVVNAHHLQNRSDKPAIYYDIGGRDAWDVSTFPDMGLEAYTHQELRFRPVREKE